MNVLGANARRPKRRTAKLIATLLLACVGGMGLAACGGDSGGSTSGQGSTTTSVVYNKLVTPPKGESAVNVPLHVTLGSGAIGAPDPTTTLPSELGQAIQPGLNPGQNVIIRAGRGSFRRPWSRPQRRRSFGTTCPASHSASSSTVPNRSWTQAPSRRARRSPGRLRPEVQPITRWSRRAFMPRCS